MIDQKAPVLIVGGSLAGLTTAAFLAQHGVRSLVIERHRGTAIHPRAALVYQRSMEILRSIDIEAPIRRRSLEQFEPDRGDHVRRDARRRGARALSAVLGRAGTDELAQV